MGAIRLEDLPHYTIDEYCQWDGRWELIYGVAYAMTPSPTMKHQNISDHIAFQLYTALKDSKVCHKTTAVDWHVTEETIVCPDNAVVCAHEKESRFIAKVPWIIFEVLSPSTKKKDKTTKYELYREAGVSYYVIVDPESSSVEVFELKGELYKQVVKTKEENFVFTSEECSFEFDFGKLFD